jgi:hypothetical protein
VAKVYQCFKATYFLHLQGRLLCSYCHETIVFLLPCNYCVLTSMRLLCSYCHETIVFLLSWEEYQICHRNVCLLEWCPHLRHLTLSTIFGDIWLFISKICVLFWKICSSFCVNWVYTVTTPVIRWYIICLFTGRVDYIGSSHQWWHLFVVLALYYWHNTGIKYVEFRMNHGCATDMRLWQFGLHRYLCNSTCWTTLPIFMEEQFQRSS